LLNKPLAGVRIVVVEDDADSADALHALLTYHGATVECGSSAEAGRAAVARLRPHVLISDLSMPREDGYSFLASVRALAPEECGDVPAVAYSALSPLQATARALGVGFQLFLRKPDDLLRLVPSVVSLLPAAFAP